MGIISDKGRYWLRKYFLDGVAASGLNDPRKEDGVPFVDAVQDEIDALKALGATGAKWKTEVRVAVAGAVAPAALVPGATFDGVVLAAGDRAGLVSNPSGALNGLYVVQAAGAATRAPDAATGADLLAAAFYVREGTVNGGKQYICSTPGPIVVGTTPLTWTLMSDQVAVKASIAALTARVDPGLVYGPAATTGTASAYAFTVAGMPVLTNGMTIAFVAHLQSAAGATLTTPERVALSLPPLVLANAAGEDLGDGACLADRVYLAQVWGNKLRVHTGDDGAMAVKLTPFPIKGTVGPAGAEILPASDTVKAVQIANSSDANMRFGIGFAPEVSGYGYPLGPGDSWASDITPGLAINLVADAEGSKYTANIWTTNGRNPIADKAFDALLARNGTVLPTPWLDPYRTFFSETMPLWQLCKVWGMLIGPDNALAFENWAAATPAFTPYNSPARDAKRGLLFVSASSQYVDTHVSQGDLPANNIAIGVCSTETAAKGAAPQWDLSNQVNAIDTLRNAGMVCRAATTGSDTVADNTLPGRGGVMGWARASNTAYRAHAGTQAYPLTRNGTTTTAYPFLFGCDAAALTGAPVAGTYINGYRDLFFVGPADVFGDAGFTAIRVARAKFLAAIASL